MIRHDHSPAANAYAVEIPGWDSTEYFFVEQCELEWNEESGKQVALKRTLNHSTILLVRLVQTGESGRSHPMACKAELVGKTKSGLYQFRLELVAPYLKEEEGPAT